MFQDLDITLANILNEPAAPPAFADLIGAEVSFVTPDRNFAPTGATVNLFLYEVKENRELRDPVPITEIVGGTYRRRMPPVRIDCYYMVTTWSTGTGAAKIANEHRLLGLALAWLSRFSDIPANYLAGSLAGQPFPPPTLVAQMTDSKSTGEFWTALGIAPRPTFSLVATIALQLGDGMVEGPPVISRKIRIQDLPEEAILARQMSALQASDSIYAIGGTVTDAAGQVVADVEVTLVETGWVTRTDAYGRYRFNGLAAGSYHVTAGAAAPRPIDVPNAAANTYDVRI